MALTNAQYDNLMKQYEQTQRANRLELQSRKEEIYSEIPTYSDLEDAISGLSVECAKCMLMEEEERFLHLKEQIADCSLQKTNLLVAHGYPADYLDPIYTCASCQDTGYITSPSGRKEKCQCLRNQELSILYKQSNIQHMLERENFSTLSYKYYQGEDLVRFENAVELSKKFVQNFEHVYQNLFFYGTVGTGKSFLSGCVANELLKQGKSVIYFSSSSLFDALADYSFHAKTKGDVQNPHEDICNCDLLIIDDLGTELTNNFVTTQLFSCLNERHLAKKATIISTNLNLEELRDRYSERIFSRVMSNYTLCKLSGPDIRILKKRLANTTAE